MNGEYTAKILFAASYVSFTLSGLCLILSIAFFIKFKIPSVIEDLSGRAAKKSIELMIANNEKNGNKSLRPRKLNENREKLTSSVKGNKKYLSNYNQRPETEILEENISNGNCSKETDLLVEGASTEFLYDRQETASLDESLKTVVGSEEEMKINMIEEIVIVHTDEIIT